MSISNYYFELHYVNLSTVHDEMRSVHADRFIHLLLDCYDETTQKVNMSDELFHYLLCH